MAAAYAGVVNGTHAFFDCYEKIRYIRRALPLSFLAVNIKSS